MCVLDEGWGDQWSGLSRIRWVMLGMFVVIVVRGLMGGSQTQTGTISIGVCLSETDSWSRVVA